MDADQEDVVLSTAAATSTAILTQTTESSSVTVSSSASATSSSAKSSSATTASPHTPRTSGTVLGLTLSFGIFASVVLFSLSFWLLRKRRRQTAAKEQEQEQERFDKAELDSAEKKRSIRVELHAKDAPWLARWEMPAGNEFVELPSTPIGVTGVRPGPGMVELDGGMI